MVRRNSVLVSTNMNGINETFETLETLETLETIQIREIVEIFPPNVFIKYKKETEVNELESLFSHVIETDVISYPSFVKPEDQVSLGKFLLLLSPVLVFGILLCVPLPAFASEKIKERVKSTSVSELESLNEIGKNNGFKVFYPSAIREKMALEAKRIKSGGNGGKTSIGRRLVEKVIKKAPLFKPKFQEKEILLEVMEPIIDKIVVINRSNVSNASKIISNKIENIYFLLFPAVIGINRIERIRDVRGGGLTAVFGWLGSAWGYRKSVEKVLNLVRGKKTKSSNSDTNSNSSNSSNWSDFFSSENSNTSNTPTPDTTIVSFIKQVGASSGSVLVIWYFLAVYNKSRRRGKKLPVPEFILPDLVPEVRHVPFKEKLYNFAMTLIDLSTPTPYAIILLALFIYFFKYAGKENNPIDNAFSFVNTLFQQLVKATETTQNYLAEELRRTNEEAKNAQKELKEEHRLQREKLTEELNVCQKDMGESLIFNQYSGQVNQQLRSHLDTCERLLSKEEEKSLITSRKISQFKAIIKNEDGSFNEQKFDTLASEVQDVIQNDLMSSQALQKVSQRWEDRMLNIDRSLPAFPVKKVVEYNSPVDKFIDGIFNIFGIQTRPSENSHSSQKNSRESRESRESRARYENGGDPISEGK